MKHLIFFLLLLTFPLLGENSHYVLHAQSGTFRGDLLHLEQVDQTLTLYTTDQHKGAGKIPVTEFIDKYYSNQSTSLADNGKLVLIHIKNLRYNPYNERLLLELDSPPFEQGKAFDHVTLIFH